MRGASPSTSTLDNGVQKSTVSDPIKALLTEAGQDGHRLPIEIIWRKNLVGKIDRCAPAENCTFEGNLVRGCAMGRRESLGFPLACQGAFPRTSSDGLVRSFEGLNRTQHSSIPLVNN